VEYRASADGIGAMGWHPSRSFNSEESRRRSQSQGLNDWKIVSLDTRNDEREIRCLGGCFVGLRSSSSPPHALLRPVS
jgi:hypothetical protein